MLRSARGVVWLVAGLVALSSVGGTAPATEKAYQDAEEHRLATSVQRERSPVQRLLLLREWRSRYPHSDFRQERFQLLITAEQALGRGQEMLRLAEQMAKDDPQGLGQYWLTALTVTLQDDSPAALARGERAARTLLRNLNTMFAEERKPMAVSAVDWQRERERNETAADRTLGWIALARGQGRAATEALRRVLARNPDDAEASYWLATSLLRLREPRSGSAALYHLAHSLEVEGPRALTPEARLQVESVLRTLHLQYCQSEASPSQLRRDARAAAFPPSGYEVPCLQARLGQRGRNPRQ